MTTFALSDSGQLEAGTDTTGSAAAARHLPVAPTAGTAAPDTLPLVRFDLVSKQYAGQRSDAFALKDIALDIVRGEIFGVIGRSGAGKSTLIRAINRLESISTGTVHINGRDIASLDRLQLRALRRKIGMIFQHFNLLSAKTVAQNIGLPLLAAGTPKREIDDKVAALLELVGLADKRDAYPAQLSGGQKQRVGIARALVHSPDLLLCDEATSALDPETTQSILALLRDINRRLGLTIILITHELDVVREICDRVAVLDRGQIVEQGEVWTVLGDPRHPVTASLLNPALQTLPANLGSRLLATPPAAPYRTVVSLRYTGNPSGQLDLTQLHQLAGPGAQVLHGNVENVQGYLYGRLLITVPGAWQPDFNAAAHQDKELPVPEIIGYVQSLV
ncbi:methionine ABC transporter ATP-binding protein [Herbaspirillum autotrophicum]|uniref:methionine ABC transporter ATP-binding protein n=1 Tax=Herbaspirillum autotrophicum TaxID=180195 RepID=UPI0009FA9B4A|nr:ATP-binding cassette domain-containing protein [Herbaspirillum autotrophicum]